MAPMKSALPALALLAALLAPSPAPAAFESRLEGVRDAVEEKAGEIGAGTKPMTKQKRAILSALGVLDRARDALLDDLRDAAPLCRTLDRAFPGDPLLDPALGEAVEALRDDALDERAALLAWMGRTGSDRGEEILAKGIGKVDGFLGRADEAAARSKRVGLVRKAVAAVETVRRRLDLDLPSVDDPPFEGVAPDFSLVDVNPYSATSGLGVSPRQHLGEITAWYFVRTT